MRRLERSCGAIGIALPEAPERITAIHRELVAKAGLVDGLVYLQVTRGSEPVRNFPFPKAAKASLVMFTQEKALVDTPLSKSGVAVKTVPDLRWARRDIKSVALLAQVLAKQEAAAAGCFEAWMLDDHGHVTEGGSSTAFIVKNDRIITKPNGSAILPGCTRASVEALMAETGMALDERTFTPAEAVAADEAFITSATSFVMPVVKVDGQPVGTGQPGPVVKRLQELYLAHARANAE
jgi:D-alanine transaminase